MISFDKIKERFLSWWNCEVPENDSVFIRLLEYGEKVGPSGVIGAEITIWAREKGVVANREEEGAIHVLFAECFKPIGVLSGTSNRCVLKSEYYFRLIEHRELQEARRTAKESSRNAYLAIVISIIMSFMSMIVAIATNA